MDEMYEISPQVLRIVSDRRFDCKYGHSRIG